MRVGTFMGLRTRMISRWVATFGGGVVLLLAAGCAGMAGPGAPAPDPDGWPSGRAFIATSVNESGAAKAIVEGTEIMVRFGNGGEVNAHAGCNSMGGTGRLDAGALKIDSMAMTEMGCPDGRMEQDAWVADFLTSGPVMRLAGDELTLTGPTITMVLLDREVADPDRPLAGTPWTVTTVFTGDAASNMVHPVPAVLTIDASGSFVATTGCVGGELRGSATVTGASVTFLVSEEQPCVGGSNPIDEAVRATLAGALTYEIDAAQLRLLRSDGVGLGLAAGAAGGDGVEVDCGTATLAQGETPPAAMLTCFLDAVAAGRTVHLSIVRPTVEGDPIPTSYRGYGTDSIQVTVDTRQDRFGSGGLQYQLCSGPTVAEDGFLAFAECTDAGTG